ncbi:MAG: hypothetical protein WCF18_04490 [Chthoniobacteraceae bacterium]
MIEQVFAVLLNVAAVYAGCGLIVAVLFLALWCSSFDPSAKGGTWGFRVLIVPGIIALWPVILAKVLAVRRGGSAQGPAETPVRQETFRRNHGFTFLALAILGPLLFAVALIWRAPEIPRSGGVPPPASANGAETAPLLGR